MKALAVIGEIILTEVKITFAIGVLHYHIIELSHYHIIRLVFSELQDFVACSIIVF